MHTSMYLMPQLVLCLLCICCIASGIAATGSAPHSPTLRQRAHHASTPHISRLKLMVTGPPAAGKSTQCALLKQRYGLLHLSSGGILRAEAARDTPLGRKIKALIDKGDMVEDELILELVRERLAHPDNVHRGWILDGFPRTLRQAKLLRQLGHDPDFVIHLPVREEQALSRASQRVLDPTTGQALQVEPRRPTSLSSSRGSSGTVARRPDDAPEIAAKRYRDYMRHIGALEQFYKDRWLQIDGGMDIHQVCAALEAAIENSHLRKPQQNARAKECESS